MAYAKINGITLAQYPYGFAQLQVDNPFTNYGDNDDVGYWFPQTNASLVDGYTLVSVAPTPQPAYDVRTQICVEGTPALDKDVWGQTWDIREMTADEIAAASDNEWANVRMARNAKLASCDWTQLADAPADDLVWAVYRQALRDITTQTDPFNIVWPDVPA